MKKISLKCVLFFFGVIVLVACPSSAGTSQLHAVWVDRNFEKVPLKKILVVGLAEIQEKRRAFENAFVDVIRKGGSEADSSLTILGPDQRMNKEAIKNAIRGKGYDAVMVSRLVTVDLRTGYVEGNQPDHAPKPPNPDNSSFDQDYQRMYNTVAKPGYLKDSKVVVMQTKIFSSEGQLIWSAESETFDPMSLTDLVTSMAKVMGRDLSDKGLITARQ